MSRYIDLDEAKARTTQLVHGYEVEQWLDTIPSINIDRPQGEWEDYDRYMKCCSKCGWIQDVLHFGSNFCPHCGCRMKGADDDID